MSGGSPPAAFQAPEQMGVDLNSSNYGTPIAVVYGQNKVSGNCCWYGDFQVIQTQAGGKGGGGVTQYDYHSSYMLVICEGPITGFGNAWQGASFQPLSNLQPAFQTYGAIGQAAWSHFTGTQALGYSGFALLAFLNNDLGSQATTPNYQIEINALQQFNPPTITDADPSAICNDVCTNAFHGIGFSFLGNLTQWHDYCVANGLFISPVYNTETTGTAILKDLAAWTNTQAYFSEGLLKFVPYGDVAVTGNGATYTPNLTPAWNFTDADYVVSKSGPPVTLKRKALPDCSNTIRIEYPDRAYYYYSEMVEARDENDAITNGVRANTSKHIDSITTGAVARFVAQNMLQRELYIRNTYEWKTSWRFAYLEPSDPVTLTDSTMGFTQLLVRITKVEEAEDGELTFTAEELPIGVGHSENYNTQANGGYLLDILVDPGPVDIPVFFRGPGFLFNQDSPHIGIAIAGGTVNWGGAQLYISYDNVNFLYKATLTNQNRYGVTGTSIAVESDPDTVSTPNVTLEYGELIGGTQAEADALQTLFMIDDELMSYETAALQSGETYKLSYLRRGAYGTTIATHALGATFVRLDDTIFYLPIDPSYVGQTVYIKLLSYNVFGKTPRTLADETTYSYVVGTNTNLPDVPSTPVSFTATAVPTGIQLNWEHPNPAAVSATTIQRSPDDVTWSVIGQVHGTGTTYIDPVGNGSYYYRIRARGALPQAGWSAYTLGIQQGVNVALESGRVPSGQNLVNNGDFEAATFMVNGYPPGWQGGGMPGVAVPANGIAYVGAGGQYQGNQSIKVLTTGHQGITQTQAFPVNPGDFYSVSAALMINGGSVTADFGIFFYNAAGAFAGSVNVTSTSATWQPLSAIGQVPVGAVTGYIALYNSASVTGNVWGDVLTVIRMANPAVSSDVAMRGAVPPTVVTSTLSYTVYADESTGVPLWAASHVYGFSNLIKDSNGNLQACIEGGTSGSSPPVWGTAVGDITSAPAPLWCCMAIGTSAYATAIINAFGTNYLRTDGSSGSMPNFILYVTNLTAGDTYYCYPAVNDMTTELLFYGDGTGAGGGAALYLSPLPGGGLGIDGNQITSHFMYTARNSAAAALQTRQGLVPLSSTGNFSIVIPATGGGGGYGGGPTGNCWHPMQEFDVEGFEFPTHAAGIGVLEHPDRVWTPEGWETATRQPAPEEHEWRCVETLADDGTRHTEMVTLSHCFIAASGELVRATDLSLGSLLRCGDGGYVRVIGMKILNLTAKPVKIEMPEPHVLCAFRHGGAVSHNGNVKP